MKENMKDGTMKKAREKAEELDKFLQDRLSEDDFKKVGILLKDVLMLSTDNVKAALKKNM